MIIGCEIKDLEGYNLRDLCQFEIRIAICNERKAKEAE